MIARIALAIGIVNLLALMLMGTLVLARTPAADPLPAAVPATTAFTYQGRLLDGGVPANQTYNRVFTLYDAPAGGNLIGTKTFPSQSVVNGLFAADLDYGAGIFTGEPRWLQVAVNGVPLSPRRQLTSAPYATYATNALNATNALAAGSALGAG